jgi:DnaJ-class molecular chaperone
MNDMKTTKTYLSGCTWCNAIGMVKNYDNFGMGTTSLMKECPICNGAKTIVVTEIIEDTPINLGNSYGVYGVPKKTTITCFDKYIKEQNEILF